MPHADLLVLGLVALLSFGLSYLGASIGLVFGQLRLPILVYWLGSPAIGAATSLAISAAAALVGAARHARGGRVDLRLMLTIGVPSAVAAFFSSRIAPQLDPALVKVSIGLTLVTTGLVMVRPRNRTPGPSDDTDPPREADPPPSASMSASASLSTPRRPRTVAEVVVGATLGAVAGIVGLLLGTLRLPAMMKLGVHPAKAVGTNMAIGSITGLIAGTAALWDGNVDLMAFGVITPTTMVGSYLGASTTGRIGKATLRRLIAWTLLGVGLWMGAEPWW